MDKIFDIETELSKLPTKPGVYIMHSENDDILYVGKAVNLHSRVRQYFREGHGHNNSPKIIKMVSQIAYFEYIVTSSEMEALVLECNFIKEYRPKYNTMMTDDKGYPYIKITVNDEFPRILFSHNMKRDKSKYFGPYTNPGAVKDTIELLNKLYKLRNCNRNLPRDIGKERPCLYYQIGQCSAPCNNHISSEEYKENIEKAIGFLNGNYKDTVNSLKEKMKNYADEMEFEKAAETRDLIDSIIHIMDKQKMNVTNGEDRDIIACASNEKDAVVTVFFVREGKLLGREHHHMNTNNEETISDILTAFVKQYYSGTPYLPKEIMVQEEIKESDIIEGYLSERRGSKVKIFVPVNINARSICRSRIFTDSPQIQSASCMIHKEMCKYCNYYREINHESIREE